jgi:hypothetical protein
MSQGDEDPRCPECGEPIGQTATYCMHCSADLTDEQAAADADDDGLWDSVESSVASGEGAPSDAGEDGVGATGDADREATGATTETPSFDEAAGGGQLLDPDGIVDDSLTVVVGIAGGLVIGIVGTVVLAAATGSLWAIAFGFLAWLAATAYLVRHRTVQGAISRSAYGVSIVLLLVPVVALSPLMGGGPEERGGAFVGLFLTVLVPAGITAAIGWIASRFVPNEAGESR